MGNLEQSNIVSSCPLVEPVLQLHKKLIDTHYYVFQEVLIYNFVVPFEPFYAGKLVLTAYNKKGLGGAIYVKFTYCGCREVDFDYRSSQLALESRRHLVSLALSLAFFISGHGYAAYRKTLAKGLGLGVTSEKLFLEVIDLALPYIKDILDETCDEAKHRMKQVSSDQIGCWSTAVTCCDGCWLIRGHFSDNCTFVIKNYITGALLSYGQLPMRDADRICDEELWQGAAKSSEGYLSQIL